MGSERRAQGTGYQVLGKKKATGNRQRGFKGNKVFGCRLQASGHRLRLNL